MDKGAHFFKTDFQIHTPRDRYWSGGTRPNTLQEKYAYACEFVEKCRERNIDAVGITDHHDINFIPLMQLAAQTGKDEVPELEMENIVPNPFKQNPVIFPGIELTLAVPCQVIVLLDADSDPTIQYALLQALNIADIYKENEPIGPEIEQLRQFESIEVLHKRLIENQSLRGKFIILPHVCQDAHKSIIRTSFQEKYINMPCVGGYIECEWGEIRARNKNILEGIDPNWGSKSLGVFQTSDFRGSLDNDLGCRSSWVKMGECTAEGLRQACLAKESRIYQEEPKIPSKYITRVEVSNSTFMGSIDFELNSQFNAIIGGRGTGKSTLLEYVRWVMQDQPIRGFSDVEITDGVERKRNYMIETLKEMNGIVRVHWDVNNVSHVITANSKTNELTLKIGDDPEAQITSEEIRELLPIRAYSQKQLSSVSIRTSELQRFVEQPIQEILNSITEKIQTQRATIRESYNKVLKLKQVKRDLSAQKTKLESVKKRIEQLGKELPKLTPDIEEVLSQHAPRLKEKQTLGTMISDIRDLREVLDNTKKSLIDLPHEFEFCESLPQKEILETIFSEYKGIVDGAKKGVTDSINDFEGNIANFKKYAKKWSGYNQQFIKKYEEAQKKTTVHKEKIQQLGKLREEEAEINNKNEKLNQLIKGFGNPEKIFRRELDSWIELHKDRADMIEKECDTLTEKSGGYIKAILIRGYDIEDAITKLGDSIKGSRISETKWNSLKDILLEPQSTVSKWRELMLELRTLAEENIEEMPDSYIPSPLITWDLTESQRRGIMEILTPEKWLEIVLTSLKDAPKFLYMKGDEEISFEKASAGEQATALLRILLSEDGGPLIIDQPEDDLNKELTYEIVKQLWKAKEIRQIIIASHDANLVVNGDAELIIYCGYASEEGRSKGKIKNLGAIDVFDIRESITKVMEGGREAFELRKQKYGF
ncbi:MAG: TrlF family AAA-like ATPase [Planctomycetota bacterium]|jgi:type III restriction enzyme